MTKVAICFFIVFSMSKSLFAEFHSIILNKQKDYYEIGLNSYILEDQNGALTINDVNHQTVQKKFKKNNKKVPTFSFSDSVIWIKLTVKNNSNFNNWILRINYPDLDHLTFFKKNKENKWVDSFAGDILSSRKWEKRYKDFIFNLDNLDEETYYLRVKSQGALTIPLQIMTKPYFKNLKELSDIFFGGFFSVLIAMFFYNLILGLSIKSKSFIFYSGFILFWGILCSILTGFGRYQFIDSSYFSNEGLVFSITIMFIFLLLFIKNFLRLEKKLPWNEKLVNINLGILITYLFILPLFSLKTNLIIIIIFSTITLGGVLYSGLHLFKTLKSARIFIFSFSLVCLGGILKALSATGLAPSNLITEQGIYISSLIQLIILSFALADSFNEQQKKSLKKEKDLTRQVEKEKIYAEEESRQNILLYKQVQQLILKLKDQLNDQSRETKKLLDNMKTSVFAIGSDFKVLPPVSKYSETIFGENIVGKKVSDFLFYNIRKGTKEYRDLVTVFSIIFGSDELQFFGLKDNLPQIVTLPDKVSKYGKTLKLSYSAFYNKEGLLEKLMCSAEDVTESNKELKQVKEDQENFQFISDIMTIRDKKELANKVEFFILKLFKVLEDFVSPISDTYTFEHFNKILNETVFETQKEFKSIKSLEWKIHNHCIELEKFDNMDLEINSQVEATSTICDMLETFLRFSSCLHRFEPVNLNFNLSFTTTIFEKIKDIEKIFNNLFEYVFLVRELTKIDKEKLKKVVRVAKLYPEFERTIDLIQQRSRLLSFLLKGVGENQLSKVYQNLSYQVKKMPVRSKLNEFIVQNNLIQPYKEVLENTKDVEKILIKRVKERQEKLY